ncbi:MAG: hypothetical protein LBD51_00300, partial [Bifidobacteriaceae bacterium]|nr:hypothetical protein [Bifidobacteriaceae bacterium]
MGRYRLEAELFSNLPGALRFRATDKILGRLADVYLLSGPRKAEAIDAARRAALVEDPRLARIIDAGTYSGIAFVLTTALEGVSLADVGPLRAAQARAVAGEVAAALAVAAEADVHHLALRPELVFLGQGDTVKVGGLAWDAALRGQADVDPAASAQADAQALVSVLYAALTARWPGETPSVMPPPPLWDGNPVAPIELVSAVPGDLNTLCAVALAGGGGPTSAAGVVGDLGVWPEVRIALRHTVAVRGPIPHAATPPAPPDQEPLSLPQADAVSPAPSPAAVPAGAEPMRPTDADVAALAADEEIQQKLAAIEAILEPLGYDLTPTLRRLGLAGAPAAEAPAAPPPRRGSSPEELRAKLDAAWAEAEAEGWQRPGSDAAAGAGQEAGENWAPLASAPLPAGQAELLERLTDLAGAPLPQMPEVPELDLPPLPDDLSELLASAALAGLEGQTGEGAVPGAAAGAGQPWETGPEPDAAAAGGGYQPAPGPGGAADLAAGLGGGVAGQPWEAASEPDAAAAGGGYPSAPGPGGAADLVAGLGGGPAADLAAGLGGGAAGQPW